MMPMAQDDGLEQMYQEVILEASKHPSGRVAFAPDLTDEAVSAGESTVMAPHEACAAGESHQFNPTCGDEATIHVDVSDAVPHRIERVVWDGHGCSISQASLSIMVDLVEGRTVDEAMDLFRTFHALMESRGAAPVPPFDPETRIFAAPPLATPVAMVPTPASLTSFTLMRAWGLAHFRSKMSSARSSME